MYKELFSILNESNVVYLDSASTTQKPLSVINAVTDYYLESNANTGRSAYKLAEKSTDLYEKARLNVKKFINAKSISEVIFTKGTTESINIIANTYGVCNVKSDDEIAILISEHHANLLPWQQLCNKTGATLKYLYFDEKDQISDDEIMAKITEKTKIVACAIVSNVLGIINPVDKIIKRAHEVGAVVVLDVAQGVSHLKIDVQKLDADFAVFSGHKMYGPMGIGVLYGKEKILDKLDPLYLGGGIVNYVYEDRFSLCDLPHKFEAGTQNVAGAIGLSKAIDFINFVGLKSLENHIQDLTNYADMRLKELDFINIVANKNPNRTGIFSITIEDIHPHDISSLLDSKNICIRAGSHCAQPLLRYLKLNSTSRISFGIYNDKSDIDRLIEGLHFSKEVFLGGYTVNV